MFLTSYIFLVLTFLFILWFLKDYIWHKHRVDRLMKKVDFWEGALPIVGHTFYFYKMENYQDLYNIINLISEKLVEDKRMWLMNHHILLASKLNTVEKILTNPEAVEKSFVYAFSEPFSDGIIIASKNKWRKMRKRLNMTFTPKYYPEYINQINYQAKIFMDEFIKREENQNRYVNVLPYLSKYFFDVTTITHLGVNTKQQYNNEPSLAEDVSRHLKLLYTRITRPWLYPEFIYQRSKLNKKFSKFVEQHRPFLENIIIKSEEFQNKIDSEENPLGWKSFATHCRELLEEGGINTTPYMIGHTVADLLVAGSDTGSVAISHLIYQLGKNPQYQELAYKEIMEILEEDACNDTKLFDNEKVVNNSSTNDNNFKKHLNGGSKINNRHHENLVYSDDAEWECKKNISNVFGFWTRNKMDRLRFMDMLIKESVRLCSPPVIIRRLTSDLDVGDYIIPKETEIIIMIKAIQRNPLYWDKPEEFYPEHFTPEQIKARPKYAFLPFSQGPRDCPGKLFGTYIMKCLLAEIIKNFKIEVEPKEDMKYKMVFMIEQVDGYPVKFVPRNSNNKM